MLIQGSKTHRTTPKARAQRRTSYTQLGDLKRRILTGPQKSWAGFRKAAVLERERGFDFILSHFLTAYFATQHSIFVFSFTVSTKVTMTYDCLCSFKWQVRKGFAHANWMETIAVFSHFFLYDNKSMLVAKPLFFVGYFNLIYFLWPNVFRNIATVIFLDTNVFGLSAVIWKGFILSFK